MKKIKSLNIAILTISDSRNKKTDKSGNILKKKINNSLHKVFEKKICKDEKKEIELTLKRWLKEDDLNDWQQFDYSTEIVFREFADSLIKLDKNWVKDKTNLPFKEAKNYFSYVKEKLESAK